MQGSAFTGEVNIQGPDLCPAPAVSGSVLSYFCVLNPCNPRRGGMPYYRSRFADDEVGAKAGLPANKRQR